MCVCDGASWRITRPLGSGPSAPEQSCLSHPPVQLSGWEISSLLSHPVRTASNIYKDINIDELLLSAHRSLWWFCNCLPCRHLRRQLWMVWCFYSFFWSMYGLTILIPSPLLCLSLVLRGICGRGRSSESKYISSFTLFNFSSLTNSFKIILNRVNGVIRPTDPDLELHLETVGGDKLHKMPFST